MPILLTFTRFPTSLLSMIVAYTPQELNGIGDALRRGRITCPPCRTRGRGRNAKIAASILQAQQEDELAGLLDSVKKLGTSIKNVTKKASSATLRVAKKAAAGLCKVAQNPTVQQGNQMATAVPDPNTRAASQAIALVGSLCESAYPSKAAEAAAEAAGLDPAALAALMSQQSQTNWMPWIIGGGAATVALIGGALILTRK